MGEESIKDRIWNCWTLNYRAKDNGYITHAFEEREDGTLTKTLCGRDWAESRFVNLNDRWEPGCITCRKILRKRGLIPEREPARHD